MTAPSKKRAGQAALAAIPLLMALAGCSSASPASGDNQAAATSESVPSSSPTPTGPTLTVSQQQAVIAAKGI